MPNLVVHGNWQSYNTSRVRQAIPFDHLVEAENIYIRDGVIEKRKGIELVSTSTVPVIDGKMFFITPPPAGSRYFVFKNSGDGSIGTAVVSVGTPIGPFNSLGIFSTGQEPWDVEQVGNNTYIAAKGGSEVRKVRSFVSPSSSVQVGVAIGIATSAVPVGSSSWPLAPGDYDYVITYIYQGNNGDFIEGNISNVVTATTTGTTTRVDITRVNDTRYTHWNVYRRFASIGGQFFKINTSPIVMATATWPDTGVLSSIQNPGPTNHTQINENLTDPVSVLRWHKNRLWYGMDGTNELRFSELNQPEYQPLHNVFFVGDGSDEWRKLVAFPDMLLIIKRNSIWAITGDNLNNFRLQLVMNMGCEYYDSIVVDQLNRTIYFTNTKGIYKWTIGSEPELISEGIRLDWENGIVGHMNIIDPNNEYVWFCSRNAGARDAFLWSIKENKWVGRFVLNSTTDIASISWMRSQTNEKWSIAISKKLSSTTSLSAYDYNGNHKIGAETTFTVSFETGYLITEQPARLKLWRLLQVFLSQAVVGTIVMTVHHDEGTTGYNFSFTTNIWYMQNIGLSSRMFGLSVRQVNSSIGTPWRLLGMDIEYEQIGHY